MGAVGGFPARRGFDPALSAMHVTRDQTHSSALSGLITCKSGHTGLVPCRRTNLGPSPVATTHRAAHRWMTTRAVTAAAGPSSCTGSNLYGSTLRQPRMRTSSWTWGSTTCRWEVGGRVRQALYADQFVGLGVHDLHVRVLVRHTRITHTHACTHIRSLGRRFARFVARSFVVEG